MVMVARHTLRSLMVMKKVTKLLKTIAKSPWRVVTKMQRVPRPPIITGPSLEGRRAQSPFLTYTPPLLRRHVPRSTR